MNDYIKKSVEYAFDNKLADMQDNIQAAIREKISTAIDAKKVEVAQGMFGVAESVGDDDDCGEEDEVGDLSESELKCKQKKLDKNKNGKLDAHDFKLLRKEDFSDILEMLDPSMGPEKYIHDFVHSDNPKFQGKSKKERIQMALGAYYSAKKANEESEQIDELSVGKLDAYRKKASDDADRLDKIDARKTQNKPIGAKSSPEGHKAINRRLGAELADTKIKSKTGTYRPSMLDKVKSKLLGEEVEQIDELSKDTLGSYVKKATDAKEKNWQYADAAAKRSKTPADTKQFLKHSEKFGKRTSGLKMATDRLNKEEVEEVNEISKDTLGNYVKKASLNQAITGMAHGREWGGEKGMKKNSEKLAKRDKGIGRAVDRLTKEEVPSAVMRKKIKR